MATGLGCTSAGDDVSQSANTPPIEAAFSLAVAGVEEYQEALSQRQGQVVLVDFWATWCAPCVEQFPHTVELQRKYRDQGLSVISVSMNDPEEEAEVRAFLERNDAQFAHILSKYGGGATAVKALGLPGPLPYYRLYDRAGNLHKEFALDPRAERQFTGDDIEAALKVLLVENTR